MDNNLENFREFVKNNNHLIGYIKNNNKSWQELYEIYDLYGEDDDAWNKFLNDSTDNVNRNSNKNGNYIDEMIRMAKNIDVDKVQEGITSLQKTLGLFGDLFINKNKETTKEYNPRPLYRRFDD